MRRVGACLVETAVSCFQRVQHRARAPTREPTPIGQPWAMNCCWTSYCFTVDQKGKQMESPKMGGSCEKYRKVTCFREKMTLLFGGIPTQLRFLVPDKYCVVAGILWRENVSTSQPSNMQILFERFDFACRFSNSLRNPICLRATVEFGRRRRARARAGL